MALQSITITEPNYKWLKDQVESQEYSSKSELVNYLIRQARNQQKEINLIRAKPEVAEKRRLSDHTPAEILSLAEEKGINAM